MSDDNARFGLELIDKMSGPAEKIIGGLEGATGALEKLHSTSDRASGGMTKVGRAVEYMTFALRGIQIAHGVVELSKALGGFDKLKSGIKGAGLAVRRFGMWAAQGLKRVAPFAVGGAGLYGLGKVAAGVAVPAMGATAVGIGAVGFAAGGAAIAVGYLGLKLAGLAFDGLKAAAGFATFGQNSRMAFNALAKYGASGAKLLEHSKGLAVEFGQDVVETTGSFKKLLAGGFNPKLATDVIKMGADMRFLGSSAEEVKGAVRAITQIKAAGRLQGDELNQLAEAGIGASTVYEALGKRLGKTVPEVMKLKEAGKIDSSTAILSILDAVKATTGEKELGDVGRDWANHSIDGMTSRIKAKGQNVMAALGDRLAPTLQRLAGGALDRVDAFLANPKSDALIMQIGNTFDIMGDVAAKALPLVATFLEAFGSRGGDLLVGFNAALDGLGSGNGTAAAETVAKLGRGLADIVAFAGLATAGVTALAGAIGTAAYYATIGIFEVPGKFYNLGLDIAKGLGRGIKDAAMYPINAASEMASETLYAVKSFLRIRSPSKIFGELGAFTAMGFAVGIGANAGLAADAGRDMALGTALATDAAMPHGLPAPAPTTATAASRSFAPVAASPSFPLLDMRGLAARGVFAPSITQHIDGSGLNEQQVAELSRRETMRAIDDYFRQFDDEA